MGDARFQCTEILFDSTMIGKSGINYNGIAQMVNRSIVESDSGSDTQLNFYRNIVIGGGTTLINGFEHRLEKEMIDLHKNCKVIAPPDRQNSAYMGGVIVASLSTFGPLWIKKHEYDERGASIVHTKCLY